MNNASQSPSSSSAWVDHIPVLWLEPHVRRPVRQLVLFLTYLSGSKEQTIPFLQDIAAAGFVALSFDPWQHGERGTESRQERMTRVFGNFRRHMWPILGQTTLDMLRVIDWAMATLDVNPRVYAGGISMGGDIAVAAAGIDHRIERVAAIVATPDWLRPGMQDLSNPGTLLPPGQPDAYAQYFYDHLNPLTHLAAYAHGPAIHFVCGEKDNHVPPDGALRFQAALRETYPAAADRMQVNFMPGMGHLDVLNTKLWWPDCLAWLTRA
jgi:dienelactone hydrolase